MGLHARIEPGGYITIDIAAWLEPRTAGTLDDLTTALHTWATTHADSGEFLTSGEPVGIHRDWAALAAQWLTGHGELDPPEPVLVAHPESRLDGEVWILLATLPDHGPVAVVGINHDPPVVYADYCTDSWDWFQADPVDLFCPDGHAWTWRTGRELVTSHGTFTTVTAVFGPDLDAPFTHPTSPGNSGGVPQILCPTCGRPCDVELPTY